VNAPIPNRTSDTFTVIEMGTSLLFGGHRVWGVAADVTTGAVLSIDIPATVADAVLPALSDGDGGRCRSADIVTTGVAQGQRYVLRSFEHVVVNRCNGDVDKELSRGDRRGTHQDRRVVRTGRLTGTIFQPPMVAAAAPMFVTSNQSTRREARLLPLDHGATSEMMSVAVPEIRRSPPRSWHRRSQSQDFADASAV
jgi:hypothetical protein